jgi:hypothetical protein
MLQAAHSALQANTALCIRQMRQHTPGMLWLLLCSKKVVFLGVFEHWKHMFEHRCLVLQDAGQLNVPS